MCGSLPTPVGDGDGERGGDNVIVEAPCRAFSAPRYVVFVLVLQWQCSDVFLLI